MSRRMRSGTVVAGTGAVPVYKEIFYRLEEEIRNDYSSGELLPPEKILAERFGVNRHTVRRAVEELVRCGMVRRRQGHGTWVLNPAMLYPIGHITRFSTNIGDQTSDHTTRLLAHDLLPGNSEVNRRLRIGSRDKVLRLDIVREIEGKPCGISTNYFPASGYQGLVDVFDGGSLYTAFEESFGFKPVRKESIIYALLPDRQDAHHLRIPRSQPLLMVKSLNVHPGTGAPVEYLLSRFCTDLVHLQVQP